MDLLTSRYLQHNKKWSQSCVILIPKRFFLRTEPKAWNWENESEIFNNSQTLHFEPGAGPQFEPHGLDFLQSLWHWPAHCFPSAVARVPRSQFPIPGSQFQVPSPFSGFCPPCWLCRAYWLPSTSDPGCWLGLLGCFWWWWHFLW